MTTEVQLIKVDQSKPVQTPDNVVNLLSQYKTSFETIGRVTGLDIPRAMRTVLMIAQKTPRILECTAGSVLGSFLLSVQLGLDIAAKEAYLVPFGKECQLVPDYRGLVKLVRNTGKVANMRARCVFKGEPFKIVEGSRPNLEHEPRYDVARDWDNLIGVYTVADFAVDGHPTGYSDFQFMPFAQIDAIRQRSAAKADGPWNHKTDRLEMAMKTGIKHHCKSLPQSVSLVQALDVDTRALMDRPQRVRLTEDAQGLLSAEIEPEPAEEPQRPQTGSVLDRVVSQAKTPAPAAAVPAGWAPPNPDVL